MEIEKAKPSYIIMENLLIAAMLTFGFLGMSPLAVKGIPVLSLAYVLFALIMLGFVLRKHLCTRCCYYGKACHCGWGLLAAKLYKNESGNQKLGGTLAAVTWGTIMLLPLIVMPLLIIFKAIPLTAELPFLIPFIILTGINGFLHKKDCEECKMKETCPGSAAKGKSS